VTDASDTSEPAAQDATSDDAGSSPAHVADPWGLLLAGLIALRLAVADHAPNLVDAAIAGGLALLLLRAAVVGRGVDRVAMAAVGAALVVALLSVAVSIHPLISAWAVPGFMAPVLAFAAVRSEDARSRMRVTVGLALAGTLHALVALYQRLISYPDALARADQLGLDDDTRGVLALLRPLGLSLSPDLAGGLSLLTALVGLSLFTGRTDASGGRDHSYRVLGGAALVLGLAATVASRSAGTALALLVGAAVLVFAARGGALSARALAGLMVGAVLSAAVAFRGVAALSASASERLANWAIALELGLDHPLGVGLARFGPAYLAARTPGSNVTQYAHSAWMHVWAELGVPGVLLLASFVVVGLRALVRLSTEQRRGRALWLATLAALVTRASFDYDLQIGQCAVALGVIAGLTLPRADDDTRALSRARGAQLLAVVLAAACLLPLADLVPRERALSPFLRGNDENLRDIAGLLRYANEHPGDVVANTVAARLELNALSVCQECVSVERTLRRRLDLADELAPADGLHLAAAQLALMRGDIAAAETEVRAALRDHPGSLPAWQTLVDLTRPRGQEAVEAIVSEAALWLRPDELALLRGP
jgi:hypothetical protein